MLLKYSDYIKYSTEMYLHRDTDGRKFTRELIVKSDFVREVIEL